MIKNKITTFIGGAVISGFLITGVAHAQSNTTKDIEGYRSAVFGMSQNAVEQAILRDFSIDKDKIETGKNLVTRTKSLSVKVQDLLPDTGLAKVSYIFGYTSKKLIQINISWDESDTLSAEQILGISGSLQNYFLTNVIDAENAITGVPTSPNTMIVYRAEDQDKDLILLVLEGLSKKDKDTPPIPLSLKLSYQHKADSPDIYKIPAGSF